MFDRARDAAVRNAAFEWLRAQVDSVGDVLPRSLLASGFAMEGHRVPLVSPQGIFKPKVLSHAPLSITTVPDGPYDDAFGPNGLLRYRYRGANPDHPDNRRLRFAMRERLPLVYFHGVFRGKYVAAWPVFVVGDDRGGLTFTIAVDDVRNVWPSAGVQPVAVHDDREEGRRQYVTAAVRQRLHQRAFRERVLDAYRGQCAFCRFRHAELLDAAHIEPDADGGEPVVSNGLALCRLHHAAFDRYFVGVRPDYVVQVRPDLLEEEDGPTLIHGIQLLHGARIALPRRVGLRPDPHRLEKRYDIFLQA